MEFGLSEEQRMLQESVSGYLASACALPRVREAAGAGDTKPGDVWDGLAQLGVQGIVTPENYGGVGLGMLEAALAAESLGGAAAPAPFVATSVMAPVALMQAGSDAQREAWLPRIASGDAVIGVGLTEQIGRRDSEGIAYDDGRLTGRAMFVLDGMDADALIVADNGGALYVVHADDTDRRALNTIDRTRSVAEVSFDSAPAQILPGSADNREPLLATIDAGRIMLAADTLGAAQTMLDQAVAYAKERRQFNRVIGSFQAVKHLCAEMAAALEPCRSLGLVRGPRSKRGTRRITPDGVPRQGTPFGGRTLRRAHGNRSAWRHGLYRPARPALLVQAHRLRPATARRTGNRSGGSCDRPGLDLIGRISPQHGVTQIIARYRQGGVIHFPACVPETMAPIGQLAYSSDANPIKWCKWQKTPSTY